MAVEEIFFCWLDFLSAYNHNATTDNPSTKKIRIVRIGIRRTSKEIAKSTVPIPRVESQRVVKSMCIYSLA
jgi:hypothetical protein